MFGGAGGGGMHGFDVATAGGRRSPDALHRFGDDNGSRERATPRNRDKQGASERPALFAAATLASFRFNCAAFAYPGNESNPGGVAPSDSLARCARSCAARDNFREWLRRRFSNVTSAAASAATTCRHTGRIVHVDADGDVRQHHGGPGSQFESQLSGNQAKDQFRFRSEELVSRGRRLPRRPSSFAALELTAKLRRRLA